MAKELKKLEFGLDSRLTQILAHEESKKIFDTYLPGMSRQVESQAAVTGFSVRKLLSFAGSAIPEDVPKKLEAALKELDIYIDAADIRTGYTQEQPLTKEAAEVVEEEKHTAFCPGKPWRDTGGVRIQAHGGALFYEDGTYYWYGENKERTDGKCPVWTWGIRAYQSKDLYNWEDLGLIIRPELANSTSGLYPEKHADRPHILKCKKTGKYVCWIKQSGEEACFLILEADAFTGPYKVIKENYRPLGWQAGDFDMVEEEQTGNGYLFMDAGHRGIYGMRLSEDFTEAKEVVSRQYEGLHAPFTREAPALFERNGRKYMLTSGMSGYIPNRSDAAISDGWEQCFSSIGNPHAEDGSRSSFNSQISQVFKVPGKKDLYIALADRWVPDYPVDAKRADLIERSIASRYEPDRYQVTAEEQREVMNSPMLESANTSMADYVWLPLRFDKEMPIIDWKDKWRTEDYE